MAKKNPIAQALGEMRAEKHFKGKTPKEISDYMKKVRAGGKIEETDPLTTAR